MPRENPILGHPGASGLIPLENRRDMRCSRCQHENAAGAKFCGECGGRMDAACAACGTVNPPTNKFCQECGASVRPGASVRQGAPSEGSPLPLPNVANTASAVNADAR